MSYQIRPESWIISAFIYYSAVILSFLGGANWGIVVNGPERDDDTKILSLGVFPSLIAWTTLVVQNTSLVLLTLFIAFIFQYIFDWVAEKKYYLPSWYIELRTKLTLVVSASILIMWCSDF